MIAMCYIPLCLRNADYTGYPDDSESLIDY